MTKYGTVSVLFMVILPVVGGCDDDDAAPGGGSSLSGEGEGEGEGPIAGEGEGQGEGEGEGEGPVAGEGEGEGPVCDPAACADAFECTDDRCTDDRCVNVPTHARCGEGKICKPDAGGCVAAPACQNDAGCVSEDPCTVGACEPATRACVFAPLDGDHDEHQPRVCGGDDCDDGNQLIFPGAEELCNDADDDCDGNADDGFTLSEDPENCGSCGNRCSFFLVCREGQCQCEEEGFSPCDAEQCNQGGFFCEDGCFNLQNDRNNCGVCGGLCDNPALICRDGDCQCPDEGKILCEDEFGDFTCTGVENNSAHCGRCGNVCAGGEDCVNGECRGPECAPGEQLCQWQDEEGAGVSCVDTMNNFWNCGGCGNECQEDTETCVAGRCVCQQGLITCGDDRCIDPRTDSRHCGDCDHLCQAWAGECHQGNCICDAPYTACDAVGCVNLQENPAHCGACGNQCPEFAEDCRRGVCRCANGLAACQDGCVDTQNDSGNCGACGHACPGLETCNQGRCSCNENIYTLCDGLCTYRQYDPLNCGECGHACGANEWCFLGQCGQCQEGDIECGGRCTNTQYDWFNCGECEHRCRFGIELPNCCSDEFPQDCEGCDESVGPHCVEGRCGSF